MTSPCSPRDQIDALRAAVAQAVVGQRQLIDRMILALICQGHVLIEGTPGLAKTLAVTSLAQALDARWKRIQFTPDLLPSDLIGAQVFRPHDATFHVRHGPVFANLVLADEINRAPAKVQSALLEAMQEGQVTIGDQTLPLPDPFLVLATQNPIEHEGTYPLPEAQVDRFLFKLLVTWPSLDEERLVLRRMAATAPRPPIAPVVDLDAVRTLRASLDAVHLAPAIEDYILRLVAATRDPARAELVRCGASPRATIALARAARGLALMDGRDYVVPQDVRSLAPDVLRHRLALTYQAEARRVDGDAVVAAVLGDVPAP
jgi:MoxR-like ATPase